MIVLLVSLARRAYHFQQLASSSTLFIFPAAFASIENYDVINNDQMSAFKKGKLLRAQFKNIESRIYLKYSADLGHSNAAYLYAMELNEHKKTTRTLIEVQKYLSLAASKENPQAMKYLYLNGDWLNIKEKQDWKDKYYNSIIILGKTEPGRAFYKLHKYYATENTSLSKFYLEKSINLEHPNALLSFAQSLEKGDGFFIIPGSRQTEVRKSYLRAAETNYTPAIICYIKHLESLGRYEDAYQWRVTAMENGDLTSLAILGTILAGKSPNYFFVEPNIPKAKAYLSKYLDIVGIDKHKELHSNIVNLVSALEFNNKDKIIEIKNGIKSYEPFFIHDTHW